MLCHVSVLLTSLFILINMIFVVFNRIIYMYSTSYAEKVNPCKERIIRLYVHTRLICSWTWLKMKSWFHTVNNKSQYKHFLTLITFQNCMCKLFSFTRYDFYSVITTVCMEFVIMSKFCYWDLDYTI